jgi:hypothetical protein
MERVKVKAAATGVLVAAGLGGMILLGSRNLAHFDAALVGYTFATLFATFGIAYRYAMWLQRPPTQMYWRRGWQLLFDPRELPRSCYTLGRRLVVEMLLNRFIWRRGRFRWGAHWLIMVGCLMAASITFPLVFGWVHFQTPPDRIDHYTAILFGFPTITFHTESIIAFFLFKGLVWAAILVIAGVMLAMWRRMRDRGAEAVQQFGEDFLPLILLFAISITGLMIFASYAWMDGYGHEFMAILHAVTVIFTLLWLPFGKFFHIFQRPAQLGVSLYKDAGQRSGAATCRRCGGEYASKLMIQDLITVEKQLGFDYEMPLSEAEHYQRICPKCRRALFGLAQGKVWREHLIGSVN